MTPPELDAHEAWNLGADAYSHFVESGDDYYRHLVHGPALLTACGPVRGTKVLDVGCGQGYFSRLLAQQGARVTGIDLSDRLIARARELSAGAPLEVSYRVLNAAHIGSELEPASFDLATGCMSLQDIADLAGVLSGANRVLREGGRLVFSVPHPCTDPPVRQWLRDDQGRKKMLCLDRYFESGPAVCDWNMARLKYPWRTPYRRYTLTEWSERIGKAHFTIRGMAEPRPDAELVAKHPQLEDCARMPYFLIFEVVKPAA